MISLMGIEALSALIDRSMLIFKGAKGGSGSGAQIS
jgi:hypothetical protein